MTRQRATASDPGCTRRVGLFRAGFLCAERNLNHPAQAATTVIQIRAGFLCACLRTFLQFCCAITSFVLYNRIPVAVCVSFVLLLPPGAAFCFLPSCLRSSERTVHRDGNYSGFFVAVVSFLQLSLCVVPCTCSKHVSTLLSCSRCPCTVPVQESCRVVVFVASSSCSRTARLSSLFLFHLVVLNRST